ncbi:hypothetical protein [Paramaledivibacter caminithermalis]|nr:hypothetical protein [Paramaledivibacter caminithermalis]
MDKMMNEILEYLQRQINVVGKLDNEFAKGCDFAYKQTKEFIEMQMKLYK